MKFENIRVMNFENALRGMRNPKESWNLSDSYFGLESADNISERTNGQDYQIIYWKEKTDKIQRQGLKITPINTII